MRRGCFWRIRLSAIRTSGFTLIATGNTTMRSFVCALQWEANPIIRKLNLKRDLTYSAYPIYTNSSTRLIVSGIGVIAAAAATTLLLSTGEQKPKLVCNLGSAGGAGNWQVGDAALINKGLHRATDRSFFPDLIVKSPFRLATLESFDRPVSDLSQLAEPESLVDMEGAGFYFAAERLLGPEQIQLIKFVSDRFNPKPFKKEVIEQLIEPNLEAVFDYLDQVQTQLQSYPRQVLSNEEEKLLTRIKDHYHFTEAQLLELKNLATAFKLKSGPLSEKLENLPFERPKDKQQAKSIFAELKSALSSC